MVDAPEVDADSGPQSGATPSPAVSDNNNDTEEIGSDVEDEIELSRYQDAEMGLDLASPSRMNSAGSATAAWFDPTDVHKRLSRDDPVPVKPSEDFLKAMHSVRTYLDAAINRRLTLNAPVLHHPEALEVCQDIGDVAALLDEGQCFRWTPGSLPGPAAKDLDSDADAEQEDDAETIVRFMGRAQDIKVGTSAVVRAANIKTLTQAVMGEILACDAYIHYEGGESVCGAVALEALLRSVIRETILAGELFVAETQGHLGDNFAIEAAVRRISGAGDDKEERPARAWALAQRAGDIRVEVKTGAFRHLGVWDTGLVVSGDAFVTIRDQHGKLLEVKATLTCENTIERIASGLPFATVLAAVAQPEEKPETDELSDIGGNNADASTEDEGMFMRRGIPRLSVKDGARYASHVDLLSWGRNASGVLGVGSTEEKDFPAPMSAPLYSVIELSRISVVSAALHHCVAMSDMGLIFTWGSGGDGALGHGDTEDCPFPRMVASLCEREDPVLAVAVASGGDLGGAHSVCVSKEGQVYTWGIGGALGHGDTMTRTSPEPIPSESFGGELVDAIACGGGFTVALGCKGHVYSWGIWQHGRLGLGAPERRESIRNRGRRSESTAVQRFCVKPRRVEGDLASADIVQVACGNAHAFAIDAQGGLYAWGQGTHGQLGTGDLRNELVPITVRRMLDDEASEEKMPPLRQIASGANHAVAIAKSGAVLAWGDLGSPALGMGDTLSNPAIRVKGVNAASKSGPLSTGAGLGPLPVLRDAPQWDKAQASKCPRREQPWRWPRLVAGLDGTKVRQVAAGAHHTVALTALGELYLWGQSPALRGGEAIPVPELAQDPLLREAFVETVACGRWHSVASTSGARCAEALREVRQRGDVPHDVEIRVGPARLQAHRAVLAARSPVVRRMIELEEGFGSAEVIELEWPDMSPDAAAIVIDYMYGDNLYETLDPLGTLAEEVCRVASDFELERLEGICARSQAAASEALEEAVGKAGALRSRFADDLAALVNEPRWADVALMADDGKKVHAHAVLLAARSLYFAERLRAQRDEEARRENEIGRSTKKKKAAHSDGDDDAGSEEAAADSKALTLVVPESQNTLLRLVSYLYTGRLVPSASDSELFADLTAASTYELAEMQHLCEDALTLTKSNAVPTLRLSYELGCHTLRVRALHFVVKRLDSLAQSKAFLRLQRERTDITHDVLRLARAASQFRSIVSERGAVAEETDPSELLRLLLRSPAEVEEENRQRDESQNFDQGPIPWRMLGMVVLAVLVYTYVISSPFMLQYVPFANAVGLAVMAAYLGSNLAL